MSDDLRIRYSFFKILTGSDLSRRRLPYMVAKSGRPGPVVWLTACSHGDEVGGIVTIQEIFKRIQREKSLNRGILYAFPLMNPIGFETASRQIVYSKEDLNRSFPGNEKGSLGERLAHLIFSTIVETRPSLVLDLHNDWINSIPYALLEPSLNQRKNDTGKKNDAFAMQTGLVVIRDAESIHHSLSASLNRIQIPSLTLELGESYVVNEKNIEYGVKCIQRILSHLKMMTPAREPFQYPLPKTYQDRIHRYSDRPYASTSGIIRFSERPGTMVREGQPFAKIYNTFGRLQETLQARQDGLILGHADSSVAFPGMPVAAFAVPVH